MIQNARDAEEQRNAPETMTVLADYLEQLQQVSTATSLDETLALALDLILKVCETETGLIALVDQGADRLKVHHKRNIPVNSLPDPDWIWFDQPLIVEMLSQREPLLLDGMRPGSSWLVDIGHLLPAEIKRVLAIPLYYREHLVGVTLIYNYHNAPARLLRLLVGLLSSDIEKTVRLEASQARSNRLNALIAILGQIGATLDRQQILRIIINYAPVLLNAEASSLFLVDEESQDLVLAYASNNQPIDLENVRVPSGQGIIGHVVNTGQTVLVQDVSTDRRHYAKVDQKTGFVTRSILAVPLITRMIALGAERGSTGIRTIGGLEALNKNDGAFTEEDAQLFRTLANQAATVLQVADLYNNANKLLEDVLKALIAAIDAKDPYTTGHSTRVQIFSLAIAQELGLLPAMFNQISIGSLLHDVGKIGIPDAILGKPGRLTDEEYKKMKSHPEIGKKIMGKVSALRGELSAIAEHHERLDGTGYPFGLSGEEITITGRIVAVADVFDAMTSDRPYRPALEVEEVFRYMREVSGTHLDEDCVEALIRARRNGKIQIQKEVQQQSLEAELNPLS
jgi:GAF domain-containing protein